MKKIGLFANYNNNEEKSILEKIFRFKLTKISSINLEKKIFTRYSKRNLGKN